MSREISPNSATYNLVHSFNCHCNSHTQPICDQDMISNLKVQVFTKDQNKKNYTNLLSMYQNLQKEFEKISDQKRLHEIALNQLELDERNKTILELKNSNENLFNELNERIAMNKKIYNENNKLFQELENLTCEGDNLQAQIHQQEEILRRTTHDKDEIKKKLINLNQINSKQENDLHDLNIQINQLNLQNDNQVNILKNKNDQNYGIKNNLNEEKNINKNLVIELKSKESTIITSQQELNRNNENINLIQNDINKIGNSINKNNEDISVINNNILKEKSVLSQLTIDNQQFNNSIRDKDTQIGQINKDNSILKHGNSDINCQNEKLCKCLQEYKKHLNLLISQNKILTNEIQCLLSRDNELKSILERDNHLRDIQFENGQLIKDGNEKLTSCLGFGKEIPIEKENNNNISIKRTYSIDGNNGIKIMDSPSRKQLGNYVVDDKKPEREINQSIYNNKFEENKENLSQNYFNVNEN